MKKIKCPFCGGNLVVYADSCTMFDLVEVNGEIKAVKPKTVTIYDEERKVCCEKCDKEIGSDYSNLDECEKSKKFEEIWENFAIEGE